LEDKDESGLLIAGIEEIWLRGEDLVGGEKVAAQRWEVRTKGCGLPHVRPSINAGRGFSHKDAYLIRFGLRIAVTLGNWPSVYVSSARMCKAVRLSFKEEDGSGWLIAGIEEIWLRREVLVCGEN
jgi:hypothetical protein